jgi:hypothetical protein
MRTESSAMELEARIPRTVDSRPHRVFRQIIGARHSSGTPVKAGGWTSRCPGGFLPTDVGAIAFRRYGVSLTTPALVSLKPRSAGTDCVMRACPVSLKRAPTAARKRRSHSIVIASITRTSAPARMTSGSLDSRIHGMRCLRKPSNSLTFDRTSAARLRPSIRTTWLPKWSE